MLKRGLLLLACAVAALVWLTTARVADARPEVCPSVHPLQPCTWVPTEQGAIAASGDWEVLIDKDGDTTRLSGSTEPGEIVTDGGLPRDADQITVRALTPGSWIVGGSTDCSECAEVLGHGGDGGEDPSDDGARRPGRSGQAPGHADDPSKGDPPN